MSEQTERQLVILHTEIAALRAILLLVTAVSGVLAAAGRIRAFPRLQALAALVGRYVGSDGLRGALMFDAKREGWLVSRGDGGAPSSQKFNSHGRHCLVAESCRCSAAYKRST